MFPHRLARNNRNNKNNKNIIRYITRKIPPHTHMRESTSKYKRIYMYGAEFLLFLLFLLLKPLHIVFNFPILLQITKVFVIGFGTSQKSANLIITFFVLSREFIQLSLYTLLYSFNYESHSLYKLQIL